MTIELWRANMKDYIAAFLLKITVTSQWITNFISRRRRMLWIMETKTCLKTYWRSYLVEHERSKPKCQKVANVITISINTVQHAQSIVYVLYALKLYISFFIFYSLFTTLSSFRFFMEVDSLLEQCISEFKLLFFYTVRSLIPLPTTWEISAILLAYSGGISA